MQKLINFIIAILLIAIYDYFQPTIYSAEATVRVGTPTHSDMRVDTEVELLKSSFLISKALQSINLSHFYYRNLNYKRYQIDELSPFKVLMTRGYNIPFSLKHENSTTYRLTAKGYDEVHKYGERVNNQSFNLVVERRDGILFDGVDYSFIIYSKNALIDILKGSLEAYRLGDSSIIAIKYRDVIPDRAKDFVTALARASVKSSKRSQEGKKSSLLLATLQNIDSNSTKRKPYLYWNSIIDIPYSATKESRNYILYILFVILISTLLTLISNSLRGFRRERVKSIKEIKDEIDVTILGSIPNIKEHINEEGVASFSLIVTDAFKETRDNLQFISSDPTSLVISISSNTLSDEKSIALIISNLANSITYGGQRVVILDLDMQYPSIHQKFNLFNDDGMSTVLSHRAMISKVVRYTDNENLDVVTAGKIPPNPWKLISSQRMEEVIEKLRNVYDVIILNMPLFREDRVEALKIADANISIVKESSLDCSTKDSLKTLESKIDNFSVIFYDEDYEL